MLPFCHNFFIVQRFVRNILKSLNVKVTRDILIKRLPHLFPDPDVRRISMERDINRSK